MRLVGAKNWLYPWPILARRCLYLIVGSSPSISIVYFLSTTEFNLSIHPCWSKLIFWLHRIPLFQWWRSLLFLIGICNGSLGSGIWCVDSENLSHITDKTHGMSSRLHKSWCPAFLWPWYSVAYQFLVKRYDRKDLTNMKMNNEWGKDEYSFGKSEHYSLSLVLITFSISSAPTHVWLLSGYWSGWTHGHPLGYGRALLNGVLERMFPERLQLTLGLLILSISGIAPFWYQVITLSSCNTLKLFGLELGCSMPRLFLLSVNVTTENSYPDAWFSWVCRSRRSLCLNLSSRAIVSLGWTATFLAYAAGLVVLVLFLLFVLYNKKKFTSPSIRTEEAAKLTRSMLQLIFFLAIAAAVIHVPIRPLPSVSLVYDWGRIWDAQLSSLVLSAMQLIGILAGISFSSWFLTFKERLLLVGHFFGIGQIIIALSLHSGW